MNKTVELINYWADFESKHPGSGIPEFCRHYLASNRETKEFSGLFDGEVPPRSDIILMKLIDRIARLHMIYIDMAMRDLTISHFEEFSLLSAIANLKNPRKTEVIYHTINELSTGLNLLAGLKRRGYVTEHGDTEDRRSKRLKLTFKGQKILQACYKKFADVPEMMLADMSKDDIDLCIQLLKNVEIKFSKLYLQHRGKPFEEVYQNIKKQKR